MQLSCRGRESVTSRTWGAGYARRMKAVGGGGVWKVGVCMVYRVLGRLLDDGKGECMKVGQLVSTVKVRLEHEVYLISHSQLLCLGIEYVLIRYVTRAQSTLPTLPYHGKAYKYDQAKIIK